MASYIWRNVRRMIPLVLVNTTAYLWFNHHPTGTPAYLPLTWVDALLPFMAWTVWPYAILLLADVGVPAFIRDETIFRDTVRAYYVAIGLNFTIWLLFPTTYPRPSSVEGDAISMAAYNLLVVVDTPHSSFPSGHITIPAVACWGLVRDRPRVAVPLWIAFALTSFTIITTRQHYFLDLLGGLATAVVGILVTAPLRSSARAQVKTFQVGE
ncbi:phosphatase PAP2 family protein [Hyalangium gracile]|uniref:phosphatase PAP2 family protein n=1 Tax=Hyalangium gracile TaxID=394092 RepID=UPI001CC985AB|nr:phosphatase PAP2 family protein [Hyalangium gracile]